MPTVYLNHFLSLPSLLFLQIRARVTFTFGYYYVCTYIFDGKASVVPGITGVVVVNERVNDRLASIRYELRNEQIYNFRAQCIAFHLIREGRCEYDEHIITIWGCTRAHVHSYSCNEYELFWMTEF